MMTLSESAKENKRRYVAQYKTANIKRIPLDVQISKYEEIKAAADRAGSSVNGYIKIAIDEKIERDDHLEKPEQ